LRTCLEHDNGLFRAYPEDHRFYPNLSEDGIRSLVLDPIYGHFLYLFLCHDPEDPGLSVVLHPGCCIQSKHLFRTGHGFGCLRIRPVSALKAVVGRRGVFGVGFMC
jgi:hypothetical protein